MTTIRVSERNPRYLEDKDGKTFIPIGANICFVRNDDTMSPEQVLQQFASWMIDFAANGGNYMRLWLGAPFCNVEPKRLGAYSQQAMRNILAIVHLAESLGIKLKLTLEHFRRIEPQHLPPKTDVISFHNVAYHTANGGPFTQINQFFQTQQGKDIYLNKAKFLAENGLGHSPAVVAIELWNEINSVVTTDLWVPWTHDIMPQLKAIFPQQLILQNLGSFSGFTAYDIYDQLASIQENPILQVHRYLDPGAELDSCKNVSMDVLCADAIKELRLRDPQKPLILAEAGAVEANHARYSDLYQMDTQGTLLHDILFAPFFAGSAGTGNPWHWDHLYLAGKKLFWQFKRFQNAIRDFDPIQQMAKPFYTETQELRCYGLKGETKTTIWCRDKQTSWKSCLVQQKPPAIREKLKLQVTPQKPCQCYLPWEDKTVTLTPEQGVVTLPTFHTSVVVTYPHH